MESRIVRACRLEVLIVTVAITVLMATEPSIAESLDLPRKPAWAASLRRVDDALAAGRPAEAAAAIHQAYLEALGSRRWQGMVEVGDVARRVGQATAAERTYDPLARQAYLIALFRARHERSVEGVRRVADAFAVLGDHDVAKQCERVARALLAKPTDSRAGTRERPKS